MTETSATPAGTDTRDNLTRLLNLGRRKRPRISRRYTFIVRGLRLVVPLAALGIVTVVLAWPHMDSAITPIPKEDLLPQGGGRNELIEPHFENMTGNKQPYVITAARAVQSLKDQSLILLEKPVADVTLGAAETLNARAERGVYRQDTEILVLDGKARLAHSNGHTLESDRMNVSMKEQTAWSETPVTGSGPSGTIKAQGARANEADGTLIFNGPATLVLIQSDNDKGTKP